MESVWFGYLGGAGGLYAAYIWWANPFKNFDDIDDWDDVTDENRKGFHTKRSIGLIGSLMWAALFFYFAEPLTTHTNEMFDFSGVFATKTMEEYTCEDVKKEVKQLEFNNGFGAKFSVVVVTYIFEISRTGSSIKCGAVSRLSDNRDVTITAEIEYLDGQHYIRASIDD